MNIIEIQIKKIILNGGGIYRGIRIPTPQTHGTNRQCVTYAEVTAKRIYKKNKEYLDALVD